LTSILLLRAEDDLGRFHTASDGSGLVLVWKRLEQGAFKWPPITDGVMRLSSAPLGMLLDHAC